VQDGYAFTDSNASIACTALEVEVRAITTLTIRGLDDETHARLRIEAARHGRSMEAEVRAILRERLTPRNSYRGLGSKIHKRFADIEGELQVPGRGSELPRAAGFDA
jgi:hypothetical protein